MENLTITVSGLPGSGSSTAATLLAKKLNFNYFGAGRLFKDIAKGTYKEQKYFPLFSRLCEEKNIIIPEIKQENDSIAAYNLWNTDFGKSREFNNIIDKLQSELAKDGNIVIDGKIAIFIIEDSFKIWIEADKKTRIKRTMERDKLNEEDAERILFKRQEIERTEFKNIYGFDILDQEMKADLIVDSSDLTPEEIVDAIVKKIKSLGPQLYL